MYRPTSCAISLHTTGARCPAAWPQYVFAGQVKIAGPPAEWMLGKGTGEGISARLQKPAHRGVRPAIHRYANEVRPGESGPSVNAATRGTNSGEMPCDRKPLAWAARDARGPEAPRKQNASQWTQPRAAIEPAQRSRHTTVCDGRSCSHVSPARRSHRGNSRGGWVETRVDVTLRPPAYSHPMVHLRVRRRSLRY